MSSAIAEKSQTATDNDMPPVRVFVGIGMSVLLITLSIFILWYGWMKHDHPSQILIVRADPAMGRTVVTVRPVAEESWDPIPPAFLESKNNFQRRIFLKPGRYRLTYTWGGGQLSEQPIEFTIEENKIKPIQLNEFGLVTKDNR